MLFDGIEINEKYLKDSRNAKLFHKRIGYLFQNPDVMLFNAKVYDEIAFGPRQMGMTEEEVKRRTQDCMRIFDLETLADKAALSFERRAEEEDCTCGCYVP